MSYKMIAIYTTKCKFDVIIIEYTTLWKFVMDLAED